MNSNGRILLSVLIGLSAGAAASLLLAPKSGRDLRGSIADKSQDWLDQLADQWGRLRGEAQDGISKMERKREKLVRQAREQADHLPRRPRVSEIA